MLNGMCVVILLCPGRRVCADRSAGVRIEDDVVITTDGIINLTTAAKQVSDVETIMQSFEVCYTTYVHSRPQLP